MILNRLRIANLRNHQGTSIECPEGTLLLLGENGAGKTTVLEAISLLSTSRSFVTHQDRSLLRKEAAQYRVDGNFTSTSSSKRCVAITYDTEMGRKQIEMDNALLPTAADLIGLVPTVALSPQHRPITAGGPGERRAFMDFIISQLHHTYLLDLLAYRRALRQRNALLSDHDRRPSDIRATLEAWDASLAEVSLRILRARERFVIEFLPYFRESMRDLTPSNEVIALRYLSSAGVDPSAADAVDAYRQVLVERLEADLRRGSTTIGPHRDELEILLNGFDVRAHASQGQHKTILIALKFAEYRYVDAHLDEVPILLLDDVFSELDDDRLANVLHLVGKLGQTFITSANQAIFHAFPRNNGQNMTLRIDSGVVHTLAEVA
ncbi:MAG: DNA replication and repair protein RecF [Bacteroidetes bacterium]|nr:DNA replication and repair protein RecF [Bacteroidota bacterium]